MDNSKQDAGLAQGSFETPMHEQLHWAEHHANDLTIAEHNRKHFAQEVVRLCAALAAAGAT